MIPSSVNYGLIADALLFAANKHFGQDRKGNGQPYIIHPYRVFGYLQYRLGVFDNDILLAALLHDTIEDTNTGAEEISDRYGKNVLSLVVELTNDKTLEQPERKAKMIEKAKTMSHAAKTIKAADRIDNLEDARTYFTEKSYFRYLTESERLLDSLKVGVDNQSPGSLVLALSILEEVIVSHKKALDKCKGTTSCP